MTPMLKPFRDFDADCGNVTVVEVVKLHIHSLEEPHVLPLAKVPCVVKPGPEVLVFSNDISKRIQDPIHHVR